MYMPGQRKYTARLMTSPLYSRLRLVVTLRYKLIYSQNLPCAFISGAIDSLDYMYSMIRLL